MFQPNRTNAEQQGLEELNQRLGEILGVKINPGLPTEQKLEALNTDMSKYELVDYKNRNNRFEARRFAQILAANHCPKQALRLLFLSELGAIDSLDDEKDNSIKADALMRVIERCFPLHNLVHSEQVQALLTSENDREGITGYANYLYKRIIESKDSLAGTIVHDPGMITIDEFFNKRLKNIAPVLEARLSAPSGPAAKK